MTKRNVTEVSIDSAKIAIPAQSHRVGMRQTFGAGRWGTVVRDDAGAPHRTVIKLDSGELIRENRDAVAEQGKHLGLRATFFTSNGARVVGHYRRYDLGAPHVSIIESTDGFYWFESELAGAH